MVQLSAVAVAVIAFSAAITAIPGSFGRHRPGGANYASCGSPFKADDLGSAEGNPYVGVPRYVPQAYAAKVDITIENSRRNATRIRKLEKLKTYPTATWMDTIAAIDGLEHSLTEASKQGKGRDIIAEYVIYNLPGRDCAAQASNGEIAKGDIAIYKSQYIDVIATKLANRPSNVILSLIIEPDSLPNLATNIGVLRCDNVTKVEYIEGTAYAIAKLSVLPKTYLYVDSAHGGWLGWDSNQVAMAPIFTAMMDAAKAIEPKSQIRGFASCTSNYNPFDGEGACPAQEACPLQDGRYQWNECIDEKIFTSKIGAVFAQNGLPNRWIVDTSRSGQKNFRTAWSSWCNVKGAGLGATPVTNPAPHVDALVWIKPPGDSDGVSSVGSPRLDPNCNPLDKGIDSLSGAPQAGQWFEAQLIMLLDNASPPL